MNFPDYYQKISNLPKDLRLKITEKLEISRKTFYNKLKNNSFSEIELEAISTIVNELKINL